MNKVDGESNANVYDLYGGFGKYGKGRRDQMNEVVKYSIRRCLPILR